MDSKKDKESPAPAPMFRGGALLAVVLYAAALPVRPLYAPWEYEFSMLLHGLIPQYPDMVTMLRIPAALATLVSGLLIYYWARCSKFKYPGVAAFSYLLMPPVFWLGTAASAVPVFVLGCLAGAYGLFMMTRSREMGDRLKGLLLSLPGVLLAAMIVKSPFAGNACYWMLLAPALALAIGVLFEKWESRGKDRVKVTLDRFSFLVSGVLISLALLVLLPAILRHFKVDFPERAAFYQPGERIFRPVLVLLIPVLWFHLLRHSEKLKAKIAFLGVAIGFFIFMMPQVLPWSVLKDLTPGAVFQRLSKDFENSKVVFAADQSSAALMSAIYKKEVKVVGSAPGNIKPETLKKFIEDNSKHSEVVVAWTDRNLSTYCPHLPGMRRYVSGKYTLCRYISRSSK